ncbi:hypothetical protein AAE478_005479 [Parahypoxylon ruwenzoriense]
MSSNLPAVLTKLKLLQLRQLAFLCGVKTSGKKSDLAERLTAVADAPGKPLAEEGRLVLSVDLGIRNLGYSLISLAPAAPGTAISKDVPLTAHFLRRPPRVNLHAWQRRELFQEPTSDGPAIERFSPASMSAVAYQLLQNHLLQPLQPAQVLIERQRWRTGGAAAVQEWTLRVNTFEAILHATLRAMRELGHWQGDVASIAPDKVSRFWEPLPLASSNSSDTGDAVKKKRKTKSSQATSVTPAGKEGKKANAYQSNKKHKMGVLASWLAEPGSVVLPANAEAEHAIELFCDNWQPRRTRVSKATTSNLLREAAPRKFDDLTDSLLQGVARLKWEENRACLLREERIPELAESKLLDEQETDTSRDESELDG